MELVNRCLICAGSLDANIISIKNENQLGNILWTGASGFPVAEIDSLISEQLHVIFILRKLLCIPSTFVAHYLAGGKDPVCWLKLCGDCDVLVETARGIYEEIVNATRKFKVIQQQVVSKIKYSVNHERKRAATDTKESRKRMKKDDNDKIEAVVFEESRNFVDKYTYGSFCDPFVLGDLEAKRKLNLESRASLSSKTVINAEDEDRETHQSTEILQDEWNEHNEVDDDDGEVGMGIEQDSQNNNESFCDPFELGKLEAKRNVESVTQADINDNSECQKSAKIPQAEIEGTDEVMEPDLDSQLESSDTSDDDDDEYHPPSNSLESTENSPKEVVQQNQRVLQKTTVVEIQNTDIIKVREKGKWPCQVESCGKVFKTRREHRLDKMEHIERGEIKRRKEKNEFHNAQTKTHKCPHCDFVSRKYSVKLHIQRKHEKKYSIHCEFCGKGLTEKKNLREHQAKVHFCCSVSDCRLKLESLQQLHHHQLNVHGKEVDVFSCSQCAKLFISLFFLKTHVETHEAQRKVMEDGSFPFICDLCGKGFALKKYMTHHTAYMHAPVKKKYNRRKNEKAPGHEKKKRSPAAKVRKTNAMKKMHEELSLL